MTIATDRDVYWQPAKAWAQVIVDQMDPPPTEPLPLDIEVMVLQRSASKTFRAAVDAARAERTAEIVAALRENANRYLDGILAKWAQDTLAIADLIERGEL